MNIFDKKNLKKIKKSKKEVEKKTIMIVDDNESLLSSMVSLLSEDYHIVTAQDGQESLCHIQKMDHPEKLSLIISDQRMPILSGIQLFEKIRDIIPNTIRIILTAYTDILVIIDAINKAKIHKYILKPFEPDDLKLVVKHAVELYEFQQRLDNYHQIREEEIKKLKQKNEEHEKTSKQIFKRWTVLKALENLIFNPQTREVEVHRIFEDNLWILGTEYSIMSSNETLKKIVEKCLGKIYKGDTAKNRPDFFLAQDIKNRYLLIEFKRPEHMLDRADESQVLAYRDELNTYFPNTRIEIMLIGGRIKKSISSHNLRDDVKYLSYQSVISNARSNLEWLIRDLEIHS